MLTAAVDSSAAPRLALPGVERLVAPAQGRLAAVVGCIAERPECLHTRGAYIEGPGGGGRGWGGRGVRVGGGGVAGSRGPRAGSRPVVIIPGLCVARFVRSGVGLVRRRVAGRGIDTPPPNRTPPANAAFLP